MDAERELYVVLNAAVPPLPAPPDRIAEVGARVRRTRGKRFGATIVAAAAVIGLVFAVNAVSPHRALPPDVVATWGVVPSPPQLDENGCPTTWPADSWGVIDKPGQLVPADGAASVTLCELAVRQEPIAKPAGPRKLTSNVAGLIGALNSLPDKETMENRIFDRETAAGRQPSRGDIRLGEACTLVGYPVMRSLVVSYPNQRPSVVLFDQNCGTAHSNGRTRFTDPDPVGSFKRYYREQLAAATPTQSIRNPECSSSLDGQAIVRGELAAEPADGIAANRSEERDPFLPSPLVAVTVCAYTAGADGKLVLGTARSTRGNLEPLRALVNDALTVQTTTDERGTTSVTNLAQCQQAPTAMYSIHLADATAAVSEVRIVVTPCQVVLRNGMGGFVLQQELRSAVEALLAGG
ncbi:hypothetical protein Rhe02_19510 [Rhizocola hellebori]|uniref:Uncharacterized protein n=1 Tax=Rhizocola hellebori TaxID=1392758 RepID=A0A8J3Q4X6_9ACTN|nr:hypothetical protein [Rhizocola hellebori]GIH03884.1 hypothetical protein Rhe02_19510 [Rhizocola hellebori]